MHYFSKPETIWFDTGLLIEFQEKNHATAIRFGGENF